MAYTKDDLNRIWKEAGMPAFSQEKVVDIKRTILFESEKANMFIRFRNNTDLAEFETRCLRVEGDKLYVKDREQLAKISEQKITPKSKSIWFPFKSHWGGVDFTYTSDSGVSNRYPIYIVSKGRYNNGLTTKALTDMGIPHYIVCEEFEAELYRTHTRATILILPQEYLDNYDTCDDLGNTRSKGPGAARNFCIDHSKGNGFKRHWVMDDNLDAFHYLTNNEKFEVSKGSDLFAVAEDFVDLFTNVPVSGLNYYSFCKKTDAVPPFIVNTRIYSCLLIENDSGYRWRGRYNEDTDLSLRVLKDGLCTIQFNALLCGKVTTQRMKGGNTQEFYANEGTLPKSKMIEDLHPDVAKVVWKFNRWHHHVNYAPYREIPLIPISEGSKIGCQYSFKKIPK